MSEQKPLPPPKVMQKKNPALSKKYSTCKVSPMINAKNLLLLAVFAACVQHGEAYLLENICAAGQHASTVDCSNYTVQDKETLSEIVQKCGSSVAAIVSANKSRHPSITKNNIQAGWTLKIR
jgi:hypothetical protein